VHLLVDKVILKPDLLRATDITCDKLHFVIFPFVGAGHLKLCIEAVISNKQIFLGFTSDSDNQGIK